MKKFFKEFKDFISRGNVLDMAVGVIVGGAFTAIINALTNQILQPLINWLIALISGGSDTGLEAAVTVLKPAYDSAGALDLANSIYINWGAFITAIINFILVAFILFCVVKIINSVRAGGKKVAEKQRKAIEKKLKKGEITEEEAAIATAELETAKEEVPAVTAPVAPTAEELLAEIRDLLKARETEEKNEENIKN